MAGEVSDFTCHGEILVGQHKRLIAVKCTNDEVKRMYQWHSHSYHGDSGIDLFVTKDTRIGPGETLKVGLGVQCVAWVDGKNVSWMIMPISSMAKTPLMLANSVGLIDAGYRGEICVMLDNIRSEEYVIKKGERLVQAVAFDGRPFWLELVTHLDTTQRGEA